MLEGPPSNESGGTAFSEDGESTGFEATIAATAASRVPASLLADEGYQDVLRALVRNDGTCSLTALNRTLVEEADWPPSTEDADNPYQLTHIALVREYIPVLTQFDAITYDEEEGRLTLA